MKINEQGIELIKKFEGCRLSAYKCPRGVWTIGYGHTGTVEGKPIKAGMTISPNLADTLLKIDLQKFEKAINETVKKELNENQFSALVSFVYNVGEGNFRKSTMLKFLNAGEYMLAAGQFDRWVYAGEKKLNGLIRRRAAEKQLFLKPNKI